MKLISKIAFAFALIIGATNFSFATENPSNPVVTLEQQVLKKLGTPEVGLGTDANLILQFLINKDNQIVVVDVAGENKRLKNYVRNRLNLKEIKDVNYPINKIYTLPIRFIDTK